MPIAVPAQAISQLEVGERVESMLLAKLPGGFGWLSWRGDQSAPALAEALQPPGTSEQYLNPLDSADTIPNSGDWIRAKVGAVAASSMRTRLDALVGEDIAVPLVDDSTGNGANARYRVAGYATIRLQRYALGGKSSLSFEFRGYRRCYSNRPPLANGTTIATNEDVPVGFELGASDPDGDTLAYRIVTQPQSGVLGGSPPSLTYTPQPGFFGTDDLAYVVHDGQADSAPAPVTITVQQSSEQTCDGPAQDADGDGLLDLVCVQPFIPPDPASVAPPNPNTTATNFHDSFHFLVAGSNPVQKGIDVAVIETKRAAVLRGRVLDGNGLPMAGALVRISGKPEYGYTYSRTDGHYDLLVNGGGSLHLDFQADGYIRAQRQALRIPWQGVEHIKDVAMVQLDPNVTRVIVGPQSPAQIVRGSQVSDVDGSRQATLILHAGTRASMELHDGSRVPVDSLSMRATEFTVGANGPARMPGDLPGSSGYTYAVEIGADEAVVANAKSVVFDRPAAFYVENFLGFPVGGVVPVGYYDYQWSAWRASDNGRIVQVLSIQNGLAELDVTGAGQPASAAELAQLGIDSAEQTMLAQTYSAGAELWRSPIAHLTPWDCNWPVAPPEDADVPNTDDAESEDQSEDEPEQECGSIIGCENSSLGESISIAGTPFKLHYQSDRSDGYLATRKASLTVLQASPASVKAAEVVWEVAGQRKVTRLASIQAGQKFEFEWDGRDVYGRTWRGTADLRATVTYIYPARFVEPAESSTAFGRWTGSGIALGGDRSRSELSLSAIASSEGLTLGTPNIYSNSLGGWSISALHSVDPVSGTFVAGTGTKLTRESMVTAGSQAIGRYRNNVSIGNGMHESELRFDFPLDVLALPDGGVLIAEEDSLWKIDDSGTALRILGMWPEGQISGTCGWLPDCPGMEHDATSVWPDGVRKLQYDAASGCVFVLGWESVMRVCNGRVAEIWRGQHGGESYPTAIALSKDGRLFIAESNGGAIYQMDPYIKPAEANGSGLTRIAGRLNERGAGIPGYEGTGGPALDALTNAWEITVGPDGLLYLYEGYVIRRIEADGTISRVAGRPSPECDAGGWCGGHTGDGGPALDARIDWSEAMHFVADGSLVFTEVDGRIRRIDTRGIIHTIANAPVPKIGCVSDPNQEACRDGSPIIDYPFDWTHGFTQEPSGSLLVADTGTGVIHRIGNPMSGLSDEARVTVSDDGRYAFSFDRHGRHNATRDVFTGKTVQRFEYDTAGRIETIVDIDDQAVTIERAADGTPRAIVAPHGQRTELELDADGNLAVVRDPLRNEHRMVYRRGGLLTSFQRPGSQPSEMTYDGDGRLLTDVDSLGGGWTLHRSDIEDGSRVVLRSAEGREKTYDSRVLPGGERVNSVRSADGSYRSKIGYSDGSSEQFAADGSALSTTVTADQRFGLLHPVRSTELRLPSGRVIVSTGQRTVELADPHDSMSLRSLTETRSVNGRIYESRYDAIARTLRAASPTGRYRLANVDENGRVFSLSVPGLADVAYGFDDEGRVERITQTADGQTRETRFGYDDSGYLSSITDPLQRTTTLTNDAVGHTRAQVLPDQRQVGFDHDPRGNVTGITPPSRPTHVFGYDDLDLLGGFAPPSVAGGGMTDYHYNRDRQLERVTRPDGLSIDPQYNASTGQLDRITTPDGDYAYTWLPGSRVDTITAPGGNGLDYDYDGSLLTRVTASGAASGTVDFGFNANLWLSTVTAPGVGISYGYDNDGLLTSARVGTTTLSLTRKADNGLLQGTTIGSATDSWSHNGFAEPMSYSAKYGATELFSAGYTRDLLGRIETRREILMGAISDEGYVYDVAGRLDTVRRGTALVSEYRFDDNSNRLEHRIGSASPLRDKTWPCLGDLTGSADVLIVGEYDAQDRMSAYGTCAFEYTANGELTKRTDTAANAVTEYTYDVFGNLRDVRLPDGREIEYLIDGQNRRIGKVVDGVQVQGLLYLNQMEPIAELDGSGNVVASFVYADRSHVPSLMLKGGRTYRIVSDHLGSVRLVIDIVSGETMQRMIYDEYGNVVEDTNPGFQPFGYVGGIYDRDTGLVRFGARDYDPIAGRWTAKDLKGFTDGTNRYSYAQADAINRYDLNGFESEIIFWSPLMHPGSLFGHVSTNIDGENFSFGPGGWDQQRPLAEDYIARQEELGRTGLGHELDLTGDQETQFKQCMTELKRTQTADDYNSVLYNCTSGAQQCLLNAGVALPELSILPGSFQEQLGNSGVVGGINWHSPRR